MTDSTSPGPELADIEAELRNVEHMQAVIKSKGLWSFFDDVSSEDWSIPWIRSDYWVGRLPDKPEGRARLERAKRALGLEIARALDEEALRTVEPADSRTRERQAERLLNTTAWLRKVRGYGNYLLSSRAENLACVPIGHLVADLNYPKDRIDALMSRLSTPEADLNFRLTVLDEEAPRSLGITHSGEVQATNDRLELAWLSGRQAMANWCKTNGIRRPNGKSERRDLPEDHAFFSDDETSRRPYTTTNKWDEKRHFAFLVYGPDRGIRQRIDALYLFRKNVGGFPTQPPAWFGPEEVKYTAVEAAFTHAWKPYFRQHGAIGAFAARVYESVRSSRLADWDTFQLIEWRQQQH